MTRRDLMGTRGAMWVAKRAFSLASCWSVDGEDENEEKVAVKRTKCGDTLVV